MSTSSSSSGVGFFSLLTVLFVGLKLTNFIDWSWWWVLAPTWIPVSIILVVALGIFILWLKKVTR